MTEDRNDTEKPRSAQAEVMAKLPPADSYAKAVFPSLADQDKAKDVITKKWDSVVGATVK